MKFSENWLREWVSPSVDQAGLVQRLTMAGLEVESIELLGLFLEGVVVGEIIGCEKHPSADKLRVCTVSTGTETTLQIVCGAANARVGLKAPLATIGSTLPNGVSIKAAALRGVDSQGMLCSGKELGLAEDASGLFELPSDAPVGQPFATYFQLPDASIEIKLTPNRPDCLGLRGLAFEVAALFNCDVRLPRSTPVPVTSQVGRAIRLQAGADCPRYLGRAISGINPQATSPLWLVERLRRAGLRSISAVVDVTNYVMLESGQPLHAFDNDKLEGAIVVRGAKSGETLKLLDGNDAKLNPEFLLIADEKNPLALAGVMGGYDSRVTDATQNVFLESAHFSPAAVTGRARKLGLHTDASHRFERGVDPELPRLAIERASELLIAIAGGQAGPITEAVLPEHLPQRPPVRLRRTRLARVLGMHIADTDVVRILTGLSMQVEAEPEGWSVTPPSRRFDIEIEEDLIEEIARVNGYDQVPVHAPSGQLRIALAPEVKLSAEQVRASLTSRGYFEAINYSFVAADWLARWGLEQRAIALANPLSAELGVMRTSLLPGLVAALNHNRHRQQARVRLFELGKVFHMGSAGPVESIQLAGVACGLAAAENWATTPRRGMDFYDLKADVESLLGLSQSAQTLEFRPAQITHLHPGRSAEIFLRGTRVGCIGNLHPRLQRALDLDSEVYAFELEYDAIAMGVLPRATELPRYPSTRRDIAVVVSEQQAYAQIHACIQQALGPQLIDSFVFDQYSGSNLEKGEKSLAIGLILQDSSRTLTDQDADRCVATAIAALERECNAKLRG